MNINNNFSSIEQVTGQYLNQNAGKTTDQTGTASSFKQILQQVQDQSSSELKFSKHAGERLADRNISLTNEQIQRLESGTKMAGEKGIQESLVMVDDLAFIVNTKNKTVITAMSQNENNANIFTNIDGAVIM